MKFLKKNSVVVTVVLAVVVVLGSVKTAWLWNTYSSGLKVLALVMLAVLLALALWILTLKETPKK